MQIAPRVRIEFDDPIHVAEVVDHNKSPHADIRFRVRGSGGYIREACPIRSIELDAEL